LGLWHDFGFPWLTLKNDTQPRGQLQVLFCLSGSTTEPTERGASGPRGFSPHPQHADLCALRGPYDLLYVFYAFLIFFSHTLLLYAQQITHIRLFLSFAFHPPTAFMTRPRRTFGVLQRIQRRVALSTDGSVAISLSTLLDVIFPLARGLYKSHLRPYLYTLVMLLLTNCQTCGLERHPRTAPGNQDKLASDFFPRQIIP